VTALDPADVIFLICFLLGLGGFGIATGAVFDRDPSQVLTAWWPWGLGVALVAVTAIGSNTVTVNLLLAVVLLLLAAAITAGMYYLAGLRFTADVVDLPQLENIPRAAIEQPPSAVEEELEARAAAAAALDELEAEPEIRTIHRRIIIDNVLDVEHHYRAGEVVDHWPEPAHRAPDPLPAARKALER